MPRLRAEPIFQPKRWFWQVSVGVLMLEFYGVLSVVFLHVHHGVGAVIIALGSAAVLVFLRMIQSLPRRWAWHVCIALQVVVAAALVARSFVRPAALCFLVVPAVGLAVLASPTARRYYLPSA